MAKRKNAWEDDPYGYGGFGPANDFLTGNYRSDSKAAEKGGALGKSAVTTSVFKNTCKHDGGAVVWTADGITYGGGRGGQVSGYGPERVVIDCGGAYIERKAEKVATFAAAYPVSPLVPTTLIDQLNQCVRERAPGLRLQWPDGGIPPVNLSFWRTLHQHFVTQANGEDFHVVVCCIGGHGRTGTALAALILATSQFTSDQAIEHIHKHHCKEAIETDTQEEYLDYLADERDAEAVAT